MWDYGTDLIKFIFEQSDDKSWEGIKDEIKGAVARWVPSCVLNDIRVVQDEQNNGAVYVRIDYSVKNGYISTDDSFMVTL
jgi:phage baseplate assembly protein W